MLPWEKKTGLRLSMAVCHLIYSGRETALIKTQTQDKRIKQKTEWSEPPIKRKEDFEHELFE